MRHRAEFSVAALVLIAVAGCTEPAPPPPAHVAGEGMPQLVRRPLVIAEEDRPEARFMFFDVSPSGEIVYGASETEAPMFRLADSTGHRLASFGQMGEGPGETRGTARLSFQGDTLRVHEGSRGSILIETTLTGRFLRERQLGHFDIVLAWHADSTDHWDPHPLPGTGPSGLRVVRSVIGGSTGRILVDSTNSIFAAATTKRGGSMPLSIPFTATGDRFWVADGWDYRIGVFENDGRLLYEIPHIVPPNARGPRGTAIAREQLAGRPKFIRGPKGEAIQLSDESGRLDTLERERIPHFTRNPLHADDHGRLWVFGLSRDSTSVDVFSDTLFLGRAMLPCYASPYGTRVALGEGWLLLECEVDDGDWPTELQLYRIVER